MSNSVRLALRFALVITAFGAIWVFVSNDLLSSLAPDKTTLARYHIYVGWLYVLAMAGLVYFLAKRVLERQAATEGKLRESEAQLKLFVEHAPVALAMLDREMRYLAISRRWKEVSRLNIDDFLGRSHYEVFPELPERWKELHRRGLEGEVLQIDEDCMQREDGSIQWVRRGIRPWYASDGSIGGIVIFAEDITERKQIEEALSVSEKKFRLLFENTRDALLVNAPPSWGFSSANRAAVKMFGAHSEAEFLNLSPWDISPEFQPDDAPSLEKAQQMVAITLREGSHFFEWVHKRLDGTTFPAEVLLTRMELNGQVFVQGSLRDVSMRKQMELDILERRNEMETLQRFHVAAQTAAVFAHELNQPLSAISSYCEAALIMLKSGNPDMAQLRTAIKESEQQALRAGDAIRDMLEALSMKEFPVESFDLNAEVREVVSNAKTEHKLQFLSRFELDPQLPMVQANRMHVQKVLFNLLHNSIEAMQEAHVPEPQITVTVYTKRDENVAQVTIRDNGPGFKEGNVRRLFEPFFTSKPAGIGMGLVISRSLIEANGGQLWVDPHEVPGATFHLTLPFAP